MDSFDIGSYKNIYLKSAKELVARIDLLLNGAVEDVSELHRLFHTIKGESFFMGYTELGNLCLKAEKELEHKLTTDSSLDPSEIKKLTRLVGEVRLELEKV